MDTEAYGREVGQRLREVRVRKRLSLTMVAERSGKVGADPSRMVSAEALGTYERAERAVSVEKLAALAQFYGVATVDLLPEDDATLAGRLQPAGSASNFA